jgi:hypothetical protein
VHLQREPGRVDQQPDLDLRIDPAFLAHPYLPEGVFVVDLEVQRGAVIQHQRQPPGRRGRRMPHTGGRQPAAVVPFDTPDQDTKDRAQRRRRHTNLGQHPQRVGLGGRLDDAPQHQSLERLIGDRIEPEPVICLAQHTPQQQRGSTHHESTAGYPRPATRPGGHGTKQLTLIEPTGPVSDVLDADRRLGQRPEIKLTLPRMQPPPGYLQQQRQLSISMRRADVLDLNDLAVILGHHLDRNRT